MKFLSLTGVLALLCLKVTAQRYPPYTVGDSVPDLVFNSNKGTSLPPFSLYSFKGKAVIIDLWQRQCRACITALPKVEQLQSKYGSQLQFIFANPHDVGYEKDALALLDKLQKNTGFYPSLPIALSDTILNQFFPHSGVPHYVWIDKDHKVVAITGLEAVNETHIQQLLSGTPLQLAIKDSYADSSDLPGLMRKGKLVDSMMMSYSLFTQAQPLTNLTSGWTRSPDGRITGYYAINKDFHYFLQLAYGTLMNGLASNRIQYHSPFFSDAVQKDRRYCYQIRFGSDTVRRKTQLEPLIAEDLRRSLGIHAKVSNEPVDCWIITGIKDTSKSAAAKVSINLGTTSIRRHVHGVPLSQVVQLLDQLQQPLLDESPHSKVLLDLDFPPGLDIKNDDQLIKFLRSKGFIIVNAPRPVKMLHFSTTNVTAP
jgi:thiol-disulfide isomerase/thioredoxin